MNTLDLARYYGSRGWRVFPCVPHDKLPMVKWREQATTEDAMIAGWWDTQPDANIGLMAGRESGLVVLDVDPAHGGEASLRALAALHGELPATPVSKTGGGGKHYLLAHPGVDIRNSAGRLGPGLDIRGDGGYIVAPPSVHPSGARYTWDAAYLPSKTELAPMPEWMIQLLIAPEPAQREKPQGEAVYVSGGRNTALTSLAGTMRRRGMGETAILNALLAENDTRCFPPLEAPEVETIAFSVARYEPTAPPVVEQPAAQPTSAVDGFLSLISSLNSPTAFVQTGVPLLDKQIGGLAKAQLTIVAARPSVGKTTFCWQIARNVAAAGHRVLFFSLEMAGLALWRKAAFGIAGITYADFMNQQVPAGTLERLQQEIIPELIDAYNHDLFIYDHGRTSSEVIRQLVADYKPELVIVDHLAKVTDAHESEVRRLGLITTAMKDLSKTADCAMVVIHHLNRMVEHRDKKEPQLADLRDSGNVEQDADVVIMPYRPDYYDIHEQAQRYSETLFLVRKNREGEAGQRLGLVYDMRAQWFYTKNELPGGTML